ncbi:flavoprotein [Streptomyces sp. LaPpAH-108]|uniref:flavoprotein n=1 Tax=Streptomyces sp. LaPpAH-108 TaxID=1155714 RepID=UPI001F21A242|nr:flavoprotein [Streptomyces sp. LaPpAH-108]
MDRPVEHTGAAPAGQPPALGLERLLLIGTGSIGAAHLPYWVTWLRLYHPGVELRIVLTAAAERFVTRQALVPLAHAPVLQDRWPDEPAEQPLHVDLSLWADAVVVCPATLNYVARLALGLGDSPSVLALQCTGAAVAVAPALPPGGARSPAYLGHVRALRERDNVVVVPPVPGHSAATGRRDGWPAAPLPAVLREVDALRTRLRTPSHPPSTATNTEATV